MATAPASRRNQFRADLSTALEISSRAVTEKTRKSQCSAFKAWSNFCASEEVPVTLNHTVDYDEKVSYLLVFLVRYRLFGLQGHLVRAPTVSKVLTAVCKGFTNLGVADPRLHPTTGQPIDVFPDFLTSCGNEDSPSTRAYPVNITILRALPQVLEIEDPKYKDRELHIMHMTIAAFFWLLRPAEYTNDKPGGRSQAFRLCDVHFVVGSTLYNATNIPMASLNDSKVDRITYATLTFNDQKNAKRGDQIGHQPTDDPLLCPIKALVYLVRHHRKNKSAADTPLHWHRSRHDKRWYPIKPEFIKNGLRHAATHVFEETGIDPQLLTARSLRPGGATALLCANVDPDHIKLLGRWKSDAMLRYLHAQASTRTQHFSQKMLAHGTYTFVPADFRNGGLPQETPEDVVNSLAHDLGESQIELEEDQD